MSSIPTKLEKCTGAMLASAIGDALGWPNEMRANNTLKNPKPSDYFLEWTRRNKGQNWHYEKIRPGEYSDDTQMILAVARSIIAGNWENIFMTKELPYWLKYERGGGRALLKAASACEKGISLWQSRFPNEYFNAGGNGAVMRILPHAIVASKKEDLSSLITNVIRDSLITHGHPRAILGATCYAYALDYLLRKDDVLEYGELVTAVLEAQDVWGNFPDSSLFGRWIEVAVKAPNYDYKQEWEMVVANMVRQLEFVKVSLKKGLMLDDNKVLTQLECFGKANGAGDVAILAAIYLASKYANNPILGIKVPAYSFGADTDTIASITGGLLGMLCGIEWIPAEWRFIQDYECLVQISNILLSDNMSEAARLYVDAAKKQYDDWQNTPIGKMRLIGTEQIMGNKAVTILVNKWESTLGQTLYLKEYIKNENSYRQERVQSDLVLKSEALRLANNPFFTLKQNDIGALIENPQLQRITFKKVLKIIDMLLADNKTTSSIAKQVGVDLVVVDLLKTYIKRN